LVGLARPKQQAAMSELTAKRQTLSVDKWGWFRWCKANLIALRSARLEELRTAIAEEWQENTDEAARVILKDLGERAAVIHQIILSQEESQELNELEADYVKAFSGARLAEKGFTLVEVKELKEAEEARNKSQSSHGRIVQVIKKKGQLGQKDSAAKEQQATLVAEKTQGGEIERSPRQSSAELEAELIIQSTVSPGLTANK